MAADVLQHISHQSGLAAAALFQLSHLIGIVQDHVILQVLDSFHVRQGFAFGNVVFLRFQNFFGRQTSLDRCAGNNGFQPNEKIPVMPQQLRCKLSGTNCRNFCCTIDQTVYVALLHLPNDVLFDRQRTHVPFWISVFRTGQDLIFFHFCCNGFLFLLLDPQIRNVVHGSVDCEIVQDHCLQKGVQVHPRKRFHLNCKRWNLFRLQMQRTAQFFQFVFRNCQFADWP